MQQQSTKTLRDRSSMLYVLVIVFGALFIGRLFQLQILRHDYYADAAIVTQESKFTIAANRGTILARDGNGGSQPLVLNETLPTLFADPRFVEDPAKTARSLAQILLEDENELQELLELQELSYVVLDKKLSKEQASQITALQLPGIGLSDASYRVYPEGDLAAQVLGFVNNEGLGQYGVEEFLQSDLSGEDGLQEAVTDVYGIPLTTNEDNIIRDPVDGVDVTLTLDIPTQQYVEDAVKAAVERTEAVSGSAIVMDPNTGAVIAMANYPTYDPNRFGEVENYSDFLNFVTSVPYEVGSVVKVLTVGAGLEDGAVQANDTYTDQSFVQVDDRRIENAEGNGTLERSITEVITKSVNTGVVHVLSELGGGSINDVAREKLHSYFINDFGLGSITGIAQANEASGTILGPNRGDGDNVRYANMTFGQGMTTTMLQMAAAVSSLVNGGDYYKPYLIHSTQEQFAEQQITDPAMLREGVVSDAVSADIRNMMATVVTDGGGFTARRDGYFIGGKTGTAQVIEDDGTYSEDREVGSFIGFGGGSQDAVEYVIMTRIEEPQIDGYAGSVAAAPLFADISNWLIDYNQIPPSR